jgi:hypothetical protein
MRPRQIEEAEPGAWPGDLVVKNGSNTRCWSPGDARSVVLHIHGDAVGHARARIVTAPPRRPAIARAALLIRLRNTR